MNDRTKVLQALATDICMTVTFLDGLVLARSAFHYSMNYRSVYELPLWAGEIPLRLTAAVPIMDVRSPHQIEVPAYPSNYTRYSNLARLS